MIEIRTIGRETLLPSTSFFRIRFDMKYSKDNRKLFFALKYTKLLCIKSIFLFLISSCGVLSENESEKKVREKIEISVIEDKLNEIRVENTVHSNFHDPILGGERMNLYLDSLVGKKIAIVSTIVYTIINLY